ncbi:MAG: 30S ribosome-binding factor RbfA [Terrisporobacter othiniensis]|uniref:Ribosome-binding factor A n=2 Tax=Terrisporobacter TaxID=1505652 RepID=A0AAX2ZEY2_9FIRM|nr:MULTISPECIES: 30S ribosome-binding factor RbfA [Terrisporobacter]MBN9646371.1 30S ribosome-binding factor RbfA [Terrisporobacter glycolicus]MDU4859679.1 30S ribosome-binding factor RbfA [Terrisporobacter othiniensis]MDU6994152.1 30S ribosome-binding factor RbfA [Terrisporobacter othiniensis]UEL46962.1 30S ribosome-binding factor RbfA [Terrisporobacter hibernicus]UPA29414.1 30S ribosome-binding factor RbfA [Terrisporobacter glycolicus]
MASYNRTRRIGEEIRKIVSTMLINGIKDPRINSMVSVTDVEVTSDLSYAYIYVSILGGDEESTLQGLRAAESYIRREIGRSIKIRHIPQIIFKVDDSLVKGMYMDSLIKKVSQKEQDKPQTQVEENENE